MPHMQEVAIVDEAEEYVKKLLTQRLTDDHQYHNLSHTLAVRTASRKLGEMANLSPAQLEILELAALFHDTGHVETYNGHEDVSHRLAREFLEKHDYTEDRMQEVLDCVDVTFMANRPTNELQKIIRDADLINLGSDGYLVHLQGLRHEWEVFLGQRFSDADWYKMNYKFLKGQTFFTDYAQEMYGPKLSNNINNLKKLAKTAKKKSGTANMGGLQGSKSAQMMFKTALRNHLDLSTLADNKANIMLSVNALIITLIVPFAASQINDYPWLLIPSILLLVTCLISMIFATLATRPIRMTGKTEQKSIEEGQSNLFFFGNFYKMPFETYKTGIRHVLDEEEYLEDSIMRDLYFLGKSLGRKYAQLRICYTVFMLGVVITVLGFLAAYITANSGAG